MGIREWWQTFNNPRFHANKQTKRPSIQLAIFQAPLTLLSSCGLQTPCQWPGLAPLQESAPPPWWSPWRFLTCRFAGWTARKPNPWTRPHLPRSRQHYKQTNTIVTHFGTYTRHSGHFSKVKIKWHTDVTSCNISIKCVDLDGVVDWPDGSVEASEEVDQSTSSVRVRQ